MRDELTYQIRPMSVRSVVLDESGKSLAAPHRSAMLRFRYPNDDFGLLWACCYYRVRHLFNAGVVI